MILDGRENEKRAEFSDELGIVPNDESDDDDLMIIIMLI